MKKSRFEFQFQHRHIGPSEEQIHSMQEVVKVKDLDELISKSVPKDIPLASSITLDEPLSESEMIQKTRNKAAQNKVFKNYIGQGFFECLPLSVTNRNIIKNPVWYTSYTPYQSELAQGRLEALLNFQTMVCDLTKMDLAVASLLDESTAAAEAMSMAWNIYDSEIKSPSFFIDHNIWSQTKAVLKTRAETLGIPIQEGAILEKIPSSTVAVFFQYPFANGSLVDMESIIQECKKRNILVIVGTDLLANTLITPPGQWQADIVIGSTGRLGLPLMYGGPHAGFLATRKEYASYSPGRIVGISKDKNSKVALRLALQTREQHIRRERATSNICTAQALPAVLASMYAVYHGKEGLIQIANKIHETCQFLYQELMSLGAPVLNHTFFDTITLKLNSSLITTLKVETEKAGINLGYSSSDQVNISVGEGRTKEDMEELISIFKKVLPANSKVKAKESSLPDSLKRVSSFLDHEVFKKYRSETNMIRYIHQLQNRDLSLTHSMIPLGSCTMKLNATTELMPMTWKPFADIHPFAPLDQVQGSLSIFKELEQYLCQLTGFDACSLQGNAGSQGEYAGLVAFKKYHQSLGQEERNICLIPASAHGTNPASAKMAGLKVVTIRCTDNGAIDAQDLKEKLQEHSKLLSCLMLTYPSTCGVFEKDIPQICKWIHEHQGLVYLDGANMNALTGICQVARIGADACHLNLHKTFCIPHGGGGPGVGPLLVVEKLKKFLPSHPHINKEASFTISSTPYGNPGVLSVPWAYIKMMGLKGLKRASQVACLNANYIKTRLQDHYRILFVEKSGFVAHECIIDFRKFRYSSHIQVVDVAKRLMDYGFHAPTMSWPVPGTLMIEPTESEDKNELDRYCDALISIRKEIADIEEGRVDKQNNPLKNAPHTLSDLLNENWPYPYSKTQACFPLPHLYENKFWPFVARIDEAYGDRNLNCACPPSS